MLEVDVKNILPVTDARARIATLVDEVMAGELYVLTRGGKPAVVVLPIDLAEKFLVKRANTPNTPAAQSPKFMPVRVQTKEELPAKILEKEETLQESNPQPQLPQAESNDEDIPALDINKINQAIEEAERDQ